MSHMNIRSVLCCGLHPSTCILKVGDVFIGVTWSEQPLGDGRSNYQTIGVPEVGYCQHCGKQLTEDTVTKPYAWNKHRWVDRWLCDIFGPPDKGVLQGGPEPDIVAVGTETDEPEPGSSNNCVVFVDAVDAEPEDAE